jgi:hypothetical protein
MNPPSVSCACGCCRSVAQLRLDPVAAAALFTTPAGQPEATEPVLPGFSLTRRTFIQGVGAATLAGLAWSPAAAAVSPAGGAGSDVPRGRKPLSVQPVFTYSIPQRREATSWREWGGVHTEATADEERARISRELEKLRETADFDVEILPLRSVRRMEDAESVRAGAHDVLLMYAAGGSGPLLERMTRPDGWNLMFLRHDSGPVYLWYEIVHPRFLRKTVDEYTQPGFAPEDVVVDEPADLLWRLRALHGLKNTLGKRIVAIGGASGWGEGGRKAPDISRDLWKLELIDHPYAQLEPRLKQAFADARRVERGREQAQAYLAQRGTRLETQRGFLDNAFVLLDVLKDILREAGTDAITVNHCMGTIMGMSKTTACLPLSVLNDEGCLAFCESDFVVIPSGVLLHYIAAKPVFLNDPTYPHGDIVTLAHCTAPRRMDGRKAERTRLLTHFESDYGVAPKVEMKLGQTVTNLVPDFACKRWVGFTGRIAANPFLDICRSQIDVKIDGDAHALMEEMKGFHWMTSYGSYLRECGYALGKVGVAFANLSERTARPA